MNKQGFTLIELLTVVLVVAVLVAMAMPMYEKAIERSHMAEARNMLKAIFEGKMRTLNIMDLEHYVMGSRQYISAHGPRGTYTTLQDGIFGMRSVDTSVCCSPYGRDACWRENGGPKQCLTDATDLHKSCLRCANDSADQDNAYKFMGETIAFLYSLYPTSIPDTVTDANLAPGYTRETAQLDAVCATRIGKGDTAGVTFLYLGSTVTSGDKFFCNDPNKPDGVDRCKVYGMVSTGNRPFCQESIPLEEV